MRFKTPILVVGALVFGLAIGAAIKLALAAPASEQYPPGYSYNCPPGSYPIGDGACKNQPTGCPWGDSVPMDKCAPPPDIECNADWTECHPKAPNTPPATPSPAPAAPAKQCGK